jgi:large subunit ribosomal protein L17
MRHRAAYRKLGRRTAHRLSLLRNLAASLISHGRVRTTEAKAKELRPFVEKLVTLGKRDSLHARRRALAILPRSEVVHRLFSDVSPRFSERPGGYTRILKLAHRQGDGASMAFIEFVDYKFTATGTEAPAGAKDKAEKPEKSKSKPEKEAKKSKEPKAAAKDDETSEETKKPKKKPAARKTQKTRKTKKDED